MRSFLIGFLITLIATAAHAGSKISYAVGGTSYEGYHAKATGTSKGLVLIIHDWDGLTGYEVKRAEMLAAMGYNAFAVDLYGKGNRPVETKAKKAATGKLYKNRKKMRALILAGLAEARRLGGGAAVVMGYCFGGAATLELARSGKADNIKGYATFHGGLKTPAGQGYSNSTAPILVAHGGADTAIKMADVAALSEELEGSGVTYDIEVYSGAPHAFTVIGSSRYRAHADKKSWSSFQDFLKRNLGG